MRKNILGLIKTSLWVEKRIFQSISNINTVIAIPTAFKTNKVWISEFKISINELKKYWDAYIIMIYVSQYFFNYFKDILNADTPSLIFIDLVSFVVN